VDADTQAALLLIVDLLDDLAGELETRPDGFNFQWMRTRALIINAAVDHGP
jgi:hypothetical protein